jgi:hypothetical protein
MLQKHEIATAKSRLRKPVSEGTVKPYILEQRVLKRFKKSDAKKLEEHRSAILSYSVKQLEYCLSLSDKDMINEIVNYKIPSKKLT